MNNVKEMTLALEMLQALRSHKSWSGETHLQKAMFIFTSQKPNALGSNFVLYKHGPYSFELHEQISTLCMLQLVERQPHPPYGPRLCLTERGEKFLCKHKDSLESDHIGLVNRIAQNIGDKGVNQLEKLATALWFSKQYPNKNRDDLAKDINTVKPHIQLEEALESFSNLDHIIRQISR